MRVFVTMIAGLAAAAFSYHVTAQQETPTADLERRIEALQARIEALEARHTFASFMPNVSERFHVMHRAGEAGDWAVAAHELSEIKRLTDLSSAADPQRGKLMQSMMAPALAALDKAIEHSDDDRFAVALRQTISSCNACHTATGSPFVQVKLDASDALSLRHPHRLIRRTAPADHDHSAPEGMRPMMGGGHDEAPHEHAADTPAHRD